MNIQRKIADAGKNETVFLIDGNHFKTSKEEPFVILRHLNV